MDMCRTQGGAMHVVKLLAFVVGLQNGVSFVHYSDAVIQCGRIITANTQVEAFVSIVTALLRL